MTAKSNSLAFYYDERTKTKYRQGHFLGRGGFAKCYEFHNCHTHEVFAGKIISKQLLTKSCYKEKIFQEITIHKNLSHKYIVGFHSFFEDQKNVYMVLELCSKRSLTEMLKRRKVLTETEVHYFMRQIISACIYLHQSKVIHRDLKLGNLFISEDMEVKVGDFGLATKVSFEGERKKTLCGTPNYIAPEILNKRGHSFEVDVWSLGCIMFTLLTGSPPFETPTLKETYSRIKKNEYVIPSCVGKSAKNLILKMLHLEPMDRPLMEDLLRDDFFVMGRAPLRLPLSCLTMPPRLSVLDASLTATTRKALTEVNNGGNIQENLPIYGKITLKQDGIVEQEKAQLNLKDEMSPASFLCGLYSMLSLLLSGGVKIVDNMHEGSLDPAAIPLVWISKWVDYTDKYGIGYTLCDNSVGVLFNDSTRLIFLADACNFCYIDQILSESHYNVENFPPTLSKKVTLIKYFHKYMADTLLKAGNAVVPREGDEMTQLPYLYAWSRSKKCIAFFLTNGTLQINFFEDHTKLILCPLMNAVSIIDGKQGMLSYRSKLMSKYGCTKTLLKQLEYAKTVVKRFSTSDIKARKTVNTKALDKKQFEV